MLYRMIQNPAAHATSRGGLQRVPPLCNTCITYLSSYYNLLKCLHWMFLNFNVWNHYLKLDSQPFPKSFSLPRDALGLMTNSDIFKLHF